jgi:hypothetical protein
MTEAPVLMASQKVAKISFPSFRRKPESSLLIASQKAWTPFFARLGGFNGVTTFYGSITVQLRRHISAKDYHTLYLFPKGNGQGSLFRCLLRQGVACSGFESPAKISS